MSIRKELIKYTPRKEQLDCLDFIENEKKKNPNTKFFLLDLPTGSGKSHLAMMIADWYSSKISRFSKVDIITAGKILQDQYASTYESLNNLKGKENYTCSSFDCSCAKGKEFSKLNKTKCEECPYDEARSSYLDGHVSLTNFHLYLIFAIYKKELIEQRKPNLLIVDECHEFDDVMSDFITIKITENIVKKLKFTEETKIIKELKKVQSIVQYITFLEYLLSEINETITSIERGMTHGRDVVKDKRNNKIGKILGSSTPDVKLMEIVSDLNQYKLKIEVFLKEYRIDPNNWVLESTWNEKTSQKELSLEPIWAYDYLDKYVWSNYDMVILMSGTILNKDLFSDLNGLDKSKTVYWSIDSPFNLTNRPIYYLPLGKMSFTKKEETFKNYLPYLNKIFKKYSNKKGIIHTNSFELSKWIEESVNESRLIFHDKTNRDIQLKKHFDTEEPTIFVSPSVSTGVSFDHDKSRFQVLAKIPYPSLASQKNKLRQKTNPDWYTIRTISEVIQACGRSIRSKTDYADTLIIDSCFGDLLKYSSHFFPKWFLDAVKNVNVK